MYCQKIRETEGKSLLLSKLFEGDPAKPQRPHQLYPDSESEDDASSATVGYTFTQVVDPGQGYEKVCNDYRV
jgi:hypothetical protein